MRLYARVHFMETVFLRSASCFGFSGRLGEWVAATATHALAEFFAFFGRHLFPALHHAVAPRAHGATSAKAAKEDLAEDEDSQRLPVGDEVQAE